MVDESGIVFYSNFGVEGDGLFCLLRLCGIIRIPLLVLVFLRLFFSSMHWHCPILLNLAFYRTVFTMEILLFY